MLIREAVVSAVCGKEFSKLAGCIQRLAKVIPSEAVLLKTGIGHLISDRHLWGLAGHIVQRRAAALHAKWRLHFRRARASGGAACGKAPAKPFAGYAAKDFLAHVKGFEKHALASMPSADMALCRAVAVKTVLLGFACFDQLAGTEEVDVMDMLPSPAVRALFMRMVVRAAGQRQILAKRKALVFEAAASTATSSSSSLAVSPSGTSAGTTSSASASTLAATVKEIDPDKLQDAIGKLLSQWDVPLEKGTPSSTVAALAAAQGHGEPVAQVLLAKAVANRLDCKRLSRAQVASALRLWHSFAVSVLAYDASCTLPPKAGQDLEAFIGVFRNPDTAANYVSHLRWACDHLGMPKTWDTDALKATLKGAKRRKVRLFGGPQGARRLLDKVLFHQLVAAADLAGSEELAVFCLVAWHFLLRVQSECLPLQAGAPAVGAGLHPSGLWIEGDSCAVLRLRVRKIDPKVRCSSATALAGPPAGSSACLIAWALFWPRKVGDSSSGLQRLMAC